MNAQRLADALRLAYSAMEDDAGFYQSTTAITMRKALQEFDNAQPERARIVVTLEGGFVSDVSADVPASYVVVDYDTDGIDEEELCAVSQHARNGTLSGYAEANAHSGTADHAPEFVALRFAEVTAHESAKEGSEHADE
jgi:hypothetical protein